MKKDECYYVDIDNLQLSSYYGVCMCPRSNTFIFAFFFFLSVLRNLKLVKYYVVKFEFYLRLLLTNLFLEINEFPLLLESLPRKVHRTVVCPMTFLKVRSFGGVCVWEGCVCGVCVWEGCHQKRRWTNRLGAPQKTNVQFVKKSYPLHAYGSMSL